MAVLWNSFQAKVTAVLIGSTLILLALNSIFVHQMALNAQFQQLRHQLIVVARTAAASVDVDTLMMIPARREGISTPAYVSVHEKLDQIRKDNPEIAFIYTMAPTSRAGMWQFLVDADPVQKRREGITAYPGDKYDASRFPAMLHALSEASADDRLQRDEWGLTLSGYAPIRSKDGKTVAILGVDMLAQDVYNTQRAVYFSTFALLLFGIIMALLMGIFISRRITGPVHALADGAHRITEGDLMHKVVVPGGDEIARLAVDFNAMANGLREARQRNNEYFYGVIQSMVRIVEAKDEYTRGHSERVAELAVKIARRMGFPVHEIETLRHVAILHDIGKLGIRDAVLNKPDKLTSEEWDVVRMHPVIGENILRPVFLDPRMLEIVRNHHERPDGKGYPDGLVGDEIHVSAQIVSVADSYDAMTSSRSYRPVPLSHPEALQELLRHKGTQFNGNVVDILCLIIQEENN
ncbi:MAG: HD-GYP domain-containing protein [Candidatus Omnitrophota bacterium]